MNWRKWLKWISISLAGLLSLGVTAAVLLYFSYHPPRTFISVENRTDDPVTVARLTYDGKLLGEKIVLRPRSASEFFCMWPSGKAVIAIDVVRGNNSEPINRSFAVSQKLYQEIDNVISITDDDVVLSRTSFMEGVDHSNCIFID